MEKKTKKLVLIDSNSLLHRAWHVIPALTTKDGVMVNAVYGFTSLILKIIKELKPDYMIACFDLKGKTFRHLKYKEYKAQRIKKAEEFYDQFPIAKEVLTALSIPILSKEGFEADDIIGTLAKEAYERHQDIETLIITGDLDTLQLVNDRTKVITLKQGFSETVAYDALAVRDRYDLDPKQLIDFKALRGDASDNIKGVSGIGEKGALELIREFGSLENLYQKLDKSDVKERIKILLKEQKKDALLSQELVTIVQDVPLQWHLSEANFWHYDPQAVYRIFQKLDFNSLLARLPHDVKKQPIIEPTFAEKDHHYITVSDSDALDNFLVELREQKLFALDSETTGLNVISDQILGLSFSWNPQSGYYINLTDSDFREVALKKLRPILEDGEIEKVGHNIKFDYKVLKNLDIELKGVVFDTLIAAYLINPSRGLRLEELAFSYLGYKKLKLSDLLDEVPKKKKGINVAKIPLEKLAWYGAEDADICLRLYYKLLPELQASKNYDLLIKMELPLMPVLAQMELNGICLNKAFLRKLEKKFATELSKLTKNIYKLAGQEFNIASPLQLKEILFEKLQISSGGIKKTKTGLSTAAAELDKMKDLHPIIPLLVEYRELAKLQSTYVSALPEMVNPMTNRVHTSFNQTITTTGRLSSSDPNLQNIPIRTPLGRQIREAFIAPSGFTLLSADYSQIELRLAAAISGDPVMTKSFKNNEDIHARTAAEIHKIPLEQVTKDIRRTAKEVNFGILYGLGSLGLSQRTDLSRTEAKEFIAQYFQIYKKIKDYIEKTKNSAHQNGYVQTLFGRRRLLPEINSTMPMLRAAAERMAINMPLQGTSADLIKMAMIKIQTDLPKLCPEAKMILQVHDSLVLEVPKKELANVARFVKETMEDIYKLPVPLKVDVEAGPNWGDLEKIENL
ncbi:MAG: DNA polymerase I [Parcubacteria group bacterium]|nr:MAG: DNA polymerase I [Parcubacteria group bacterium]